MRDEILTQLWIVLFVVFMEFVFFNLAIKTNEKGLLLLAIVVPLIVLFGLANQLELNKIRRMIK